MRRMLLLPACVALIAVLPACTQEQTTIPEYVLTYADNQPANYPTALGAQKFAKRVEESTQGNIVIQTKFGGEYGSEEEVLAQMSFGGIDFARLSLSSLADELPALNVLQLPYLYEDSDHMWRILDGDIGEAFLQVFEQKDLIGLSWYDAGARSFYSDDKPIRSPEDLKGLTVRVQDSQIVVDMVKLLGATPVTLPYSDVYSAFETGQIDAAENNWSSYEAMDHYKVAKYYTVDEHSRVPEVQLASGKTWAKFSEEEQSIILECAKESSRYERRLWAQWETSARPSVIAKGCEEIVLSEEALAQFREIVQPLYEKYCADYMDVIDQIQNG